MYYQIIISEEIHYLCLIPYKALNLIISGTITLHSNVSLYLSYNNLVL